ncbi:MAG: hypothetical protein H0T75_06000 [Rhizobiales bacterium]|nr:hypothetical protein [Hyphomicrobiales bacterium]
MQDLEKRLDRLYAGETEIVTAPEFERLFAEVGLSEDARKAAAFALAEGKGCSVRFIGTEAFYAAFICKANARQNSN